MQFVPGSMVVEMELRQRLDGQRIENTLYFLGDEAPNVTTMRALAVAMGNWWQEAIAPLVSVDLTLNEIYTTDLTTQTGPTDTLAYTTPIPGEIAFESLPNNVSLAVSFRTAARGRSARGRNYMAGLTDDQVLHNTVEADVATSFANAYNNIPTRLEGLGYTWVVFSRFSGGLPRVAGLVRPVTTAIVVDRTVDSQRRRLPGRGS